MKAIKRTVAALLATLMLATSTSFTLAAENYSDAEAVVVAKVNAAGIMTGTDKGFEPSKSLTRAEAAAIIVRMKGISESAVKTAAGTTLFNDVAASHWASGYVNQASNLGIVKGVSATEFAPDREVTIAEFTTMAVRALGAGQLVDAEGTWPTNYVNFANEEGLLDEVNAIYTATATRLQAATIVANSLDAEMWGKAAVKSNGELTWSKNGKTILDDVLNLELVEDKPCNEVSIKDSTFNGIDVVESFDLSNVKKGLKYDYYLNEDGDIEGLWLSEKEKSTSVEFTAITKVTSGEKVKLMVDGKEKEYDTELTKYTLNEEEITLAKNKDAFGVAYLDDKNNVTSIYAEQYVVYGVVDEVKTKKVTLVTPGTDVLVSDDYDNLSLITIDEDEIDYFFSKEGKAISVSDLKEDDVVAFYTVEDDDDKVIKYVGEVLSADAEGEIKAISTSKNTIKIDGKTYDVYDADLLAELDVEDEVEIYLNHEGKVVLVNMIDETVGKVAIVKSIRKITGKYNDNAEVVLFFEDGTTSDALTIDLDETKKELSLADNDIDTLLANVHRGDVVCYSISGDEVTFEAKNATKAEYASVTGALTIRKNSADIDGIEIDEKTKFFRVKNDADKAYLTSIEEVEFDSLDTMPSVTVTVADIRYDGTTKDYAGIVVFGNGTTLNRTSDLNLVFVTNLFQGKDERTVEGYSIEGEEVSFTLTDDDDAYNEFVAGLIGGLYDFEMSGNKVVKVSTLAGTDNDAYEDDELVDEFTPATHDYTDADYDKTKFAKVTYFNSNKTLAKLDSTQYALAKDVLVLKYNLDDAEWSVKSIDDIDKYDSEAEENTVIVDAVSYTDVASENDTEIVLLVYVTKK